MKSMGVRENIYTAATPESLQQQHAAVEKALSARDAAYAKELARHRANDKLCRDFAAAADPFSKWISEQKDKITKSKADLDGQLAYVNERLNKLASDGAPMAGIKEISAKMDDAGITNNRHSTLTLKDVEVQWQQWQAFLNLKKKMLEEEIEHVKMRGITAEQFKEIEETFGQFDENKNGVIDRKELKTCLYSLGEDKSKSEVTAIMEKYGKPGTGIHLAGFRDFMIGVLGDSDTKDEILEGFKLINRGTDTAFVDKLEQVMNDHDLQYFTRTAPKAGNAFDYRKWTEDVFAR